MLEGGGLEPSDGLDLFVADEEGEVACGRPVGEPALAAVGEGELDGAVGVESVGPAVPVGTLDLAAVERPKVVEAEPDLVGELAAVGEAAGVGGAVLGGDAEAAEVG